jgi:hypothetical protein
MTHRPFDDHTLCLLNAAVWFVEQPSFGRRYMSWRRVEIATNAVAEIQKRLAVEPQKLDNGRNEDRRGGQPRRTSNLHAYPDRADRAEADTKEYQSPPSQSIE